MTAEGTCKHSCDQGLPLPKPSDTAGNTLSSGSSTARSVSLITTNGSANGVKCWAYLCPSFDSVEHQPLPLGRVIGGQDGI